MLGWEVWCGRGWVEDVCGSYGRKWAMRDNEVGKREWDLSLRTGLVSVTGWAPALAGLSIVRINVIKRMCPSCFSFPYLPTCHSESSPVTRKLRALSIYGCLVLGFPTPRIMSLCNSPCLWMIHSQVFCYGTEKRLRSLSTSPFIRNPHRTSGDCSKWVVFPASLRRQLPILGIYKLWGYRVIVVLSK